MPHKNRIPTNTSRLESLTAHGGLRHVADCVAYVVFSRFDVSVEKAKAKLSLLIAQYFNSALPPSTLAIGDPIRIFLIHIRDPQFYALPAATRANNGNIRVMGFPPIGIMSLSAVLKRAGHECVMFDQANPETPNDVIIDQIRRQSPELVGLSFLSTTSYPYAKILARQIRAAHSNVKIAFGGVFATLDLQP